MAEPIANGDLEAVVVCNGCSDDTATVARAAAPGVTVVELAESGKIAALNAGDQAATVFPRLYIDADVDVSWSDIKAVVAELSNGRTLCAAPRPRFVVDGRPWAVRSFYKVWEQLPFIDGEVVGNGFYGLSEEGRKRFDAFPDVTGDDFFVMRQFADTERKAIPDAEFRIFTPTRLEGLLRMRTRVYRGNVELVDAGVTETAQTGDPQAELMRLVAKPMWFAPVLAYIAINLLAKLRARRSTPDGGWERDDSARAARSAGRSRGTHTGPIGYVVSRYPTVSHTFVLREVQALRAKGVEVETFSVVRTDKKDHLSEAEQQEAARTHALRPVSLATVAQVHLRAALRHPRAWAATLAYAWGQSPPGGRARLWQIFYFVEAILLWAECERLKIRHLHAHFANVGADVAWLASEFGCRTDGAGSWKWTMTMHGPTEFSHIERYNLRRKAMAAERVICITDFARSQLMALVPPPTWERFVVIHSGVDLSRFPAGWAAERAHERRDSVAPVEILNVGRLDPVKGQAVLVEAMALLRDRGVDCHLTVIGGGDAEEDLAAAVSELDLSSRIDLVGAKGQDEVAASFRQADIYCMPSFQEGLPIVIMEAMAAELPVVVTAIAAIPELVVDGESGYIVPPGRADALADAIEVLCTDAERRRTFGEKGRQAVVASHDADACAAQVADFLAVTSGGRDRRRSRAAW